MDFEYEYTVSGTIDIDLDWIMDEMKDEASGKPDIEKFDDAYWGYYEEMVDDLYWDTCEAETLERIEDDVRAEIIKRIKEDEDNGKEV